MAKFHAITLKKSASLHAQVVRAVIGPFLGELERIVRFARFATIIFCLSEVRPSPFIDFLSSSDNEGDGSLNDY